MGEDGKVVILGFFGGGPELAGVDGCGDPVEAGFCGLEVVVVEGVPGGGFEVFLGFSEVNVARDGDGLAGLVGGEGVEGELEVFPELGWVGLLDGGAVGGDVGGLVFWGEFDAVGLFAFGDVAGFVVDDTEFTGVGVAVDAVDFSDDVDAVGGDDDFFFDVDDFPAFGADL